MTKEKLQKLMEEFSDKSSLNYLGGKGGAHEQASADLNNYAKNNLISDPNSLKIDEGNMLKGMRFFQRPIFSAAKADDPDFLVIKQPKVVGEHHFMPKDWLPGAKTVISVFLPIERSTVEANKKDPVEPALEWVYTRVDGQQFLLALGAHIRDALIAEGYKAVTPYTEDRFIMRVGGEATSGTEHIPQFSSNWSERHVGVAAGLGTFGLSTNFISRAGSAGRLISVVTDWEAEPDKKDYSDWLGYCNRCKACIRLCPPQAHFEDKEGKDHAACGAFIGKVSEKHAPRYGCGKCMVNVPCEDRAMR
ncbi:MAG: epoxyqueuosine reductase [Oscillospiraceae bacterium]|nr:epoxyqueuosine reductase [Oscillospiraceae bacterium]